MEVTHLQALAGHHEDKDGTIDRLPRDRYGTKLLRLKVAEARALERATEAQRLCLQLKKKFKEPRQHNVPRQYLVDLRCISLTFVSPSGNACTQEECNATRTD